MSRRWRGFYFITDSRLTTAGVVEDVRAALSVGVALVQYREKEKPIDERRAEAAVILELCRAARTPLIVNDDVALAAEIGADGVHLGQRDAPPSEARRALPPGRGVGPEAIIWVSAGTPGEARAAEAAGADYIAASPVFATATKLDAGPGIGLDGLSALRTVTELPLAAIGGIGPGEVAAVVAAGADMVCAISASLAGGRVAGNIRALKKAMRTP